MGESRRRAAVCFCLLAVGLGCGGFPRPDGHADPLGRLPRGVSPLDYELSLAIDPRTSRFSGQAVIEVGLELPLRTIWLRGGRLCLDPLLRASEAWTPLDRQSQRPETREAARRWVEQNFGALVERQGPAPSRFFSARNGGA